MRTNKQYFILFFVLVLMSSLGLAFSTSLSKTIYQPSETASLTITTTTNPEKGDPYTVVWFNGTVLETDTGNLASIVGGDTFETYTFSSGASYTASYVNITVGATTQQIYFNVTGSSVYNLDINDASFSPNALMGKIFAIDFRVREANSSKELDNAKCIVYGTDSNNAPLQVCGDVKTYAGRGVCEGVLDNQIFTENTQYLAKVRCSCGIGDGACYDQDGKTVEKKHGEIIYEFVVQPWINVNTITDKTTYTLNDKEVIVCANITNLQDERISMDIIYNFRCGGGDASTDRIIINEYEELRGVSANTTQNQCARLPIINYPTLQNKVNNCYAATDVRLLTKDSQTILFTYPTTSPTFNITSTSSVNTLEVNDMSGSIAITIFALISAGILFVLPFIKKPFSENLITDLIIRRSCWVVSCILMAFNSGIMSTIAAGTGLDLTGEMFRYMWLFGWGAYLLAFYLIISTFFEGIKLWNTIVNERRFG